jgi:hypothetical protein
MQRKWLFAAAGGFPVKLPKFPCSERIPPRVSDFAAIRCISGGESKKIKGLVLIFSTLARTREGQQTGRQSKAAGH